MEHGGPQALAAAEESDSASSSDTQKDAEVSGTQQKRVRFLEEDASSVEALNLQTETFALNTCGVADEELLLHRAVHEDNLPEVLRLLRMGCDPNSTKASRLGEPPLFEAVAAENADMVAALLLQKADPGLQSSLGMCAADLASDSMQALLDVFIHVGPVPQATREAMAVLSPDMRYAVLQRPDPAAEAEEESDGCSGDHRMPLVRAMEMGDLALLLRHLENGADVHAVNEWGETPLFEAAATGDADMVALLLLFGADPCHTTDANLRAEDIASTTALVWLLRLWRGWQLAPDALEEVGQSMCCRMRRLVAEHLWDWSAETHEAWPVEQPKALVKEEQQQ